VTIHAPGCHPWLNGNAMSGFNSIELYPRLTGKFERFAGFSPGMLLFTRTPRLIYVVLLVAGVRCSVEAHRGRLPASPVLDALYS
jgi:hypothetical protein